MFRHLLACLCLASVACVAGTNDDDATDESQDEIRAAEAKSFTIRHSSGGFGPPSAPGTCRASGNWTVDLDGRTLKGQGCVNARPTTVDRAISDEEYNRLRKTLLKIKMTSKPAACPKDATSASLDVVRATREDKYIAERKACASDRIPVTSKSIYALYDLATELAGVETE
jgi:hypothetical protein